MRRIKKARVKNAVMRRLSRKKWDVIKEVSEGLKRDFETYIEDFLDQTDFADIKYVINNPGFIGTGGIAYCALTLCPKFVRLFNSVLRDHGTSMSKELKLHWQAMTDYTTMLTDIYAPELEKKLKGYAKEGDRLDVFEQAIIRIHYDVDNELGLDKDTEWPDDVINDFEDEWEIAAEAAISLRNAREEAESVLGKL